jgi:hypothetical protein
VIRVAAALLLISTAAWADPPVSAPPDVPQDVMVRARAHFEAGRALYTLGRFEQALPEFVAGYQLVPRPEFLLDVAHCHRRLGHVAQARTMYQQFLVEARPGDPRLPEVRRLLAELPLVAPAPPSVAAPAIAPLAPVVVTAPAPARRSFWRRHWWIVPVTTAVLAGAAVGIYFAARPSDSINCASVGLGCVDARGR